MRQMYLSHKFVEFIPERLEKGVLYISQHYGTAVHKCCCGCGVEVVTPLTPTDWTLRMDGNVVTLRPSIGNWSFSCKSHYWIYKSKIIWAGQMSQQQIEHGRVIDHATKQAYFERVNRKKDSHSKLSSNENFCQNKNPGLLKSLWWAIKSWWKSGKE